jgi:isopentenyl phosphate kinase
MKQQIEELAVAVHGALAFGHLLAVFFHVRNRNWKSATIHSAVLAYDAYSVAVHLDRRRRDAEDDTRDRGGGLP